MYGLSVAWNGSIFVAAGSGGSAASNILTSVDGRVWTTTTGFPSPFCVWLVQLRGMVICG
jgi:hypothetical protein